MFIRRIRYWLNSAKRRTALFEEMQSHIEEKAAELRTKGLSEADAYAEARRRFGNVLLKQEQSREVWIARYWSDGVQDFRHAARMMKRSAGFSAVAILSISIGLGANTAIFTIVNSVLLRPLPYKDADRIFRIVQSRPPESAPDNVPLRMQGISTDDLQQWRTRTTSFSQMAAYSPAELTLLASKGAARVPTVMISPAMFPLLGAKPLFGRVFQPSEEEPGNDAVVILSHSAWQKYLGADLQIAGRMLRLEGRTYSVIGVMPQEFSFPDRETEFWVPLVLHPIVRTSDQRSTEMLKTLVRLADGVSIEAATAEANALFVGFRKEQNRFFAENPGPAGVPLVPPTPFGSDERIRIDLVGLKDELIAPVRPAMIALLAAVGLVLMIACANLANLLLARSARRQMEIGIRAALGAGRNRLVRQVLTESTLLAVFGGTFGTLLAAAGIHLLKTVNIVNIPRIDEIRMDSLVFAFTTAISIGTGFMFGLAPAFQISLADHMQTIKAGAADASSGSRLFGWNATRNFLTVTQISIAVVLLTAASLLINSFLKLSHVDRGYNPSNLLTFRLSLPDTIKGFVDPVFTEQVLARVQALPEVRSAAVGSMMPMLQERGMDAPIFIQGRPEPAKPQDIIRASVRIISNSFLNTMGMHLVGGRNFDDRDSSGRPPVVLVNKTFVSNYFRNEQAIGKRLRLGRGGSLPLVEIVGIVDNVQYEDLGPVPASEMYLNVQQASSFLPPVPPPPGVPDGAFPRRTWTAGPMVFAVRTIDEPANEAARIRGIVAEVNSRLIMDDTDTMDQRLSVYVVRPRFYAILMGIFSVIAVTLAAIGIYGVVAYSVSQRTREIGIRIVMGAEQRAVLQFVLRQSLVLITVGIVLGILGAFAFTRYLETLLFGLTPTDPGTFIFAVGFISLVAGFASYAPARRATKVDLAVALRHE